MIDRLIDELKALEERYDKTSPYRKGVVSLKLLKAVNHYIDTLEMEIRSLLVLQDYVKHRDRDPFSKKTVVFMPGLQSIRMTAAQQAVAEDCLAGKLTVNQAVAYMRDNGLLTEPWPLDLIRFFTEALFGMRESQEAFICSSLSGSWITDSEDEQPDLSPFRFPQSRTEDILKSLHLFSINRTPKSLMHRFLLDKIIYIDKMVTDWAREIMGGDMPKKLEPGAYLKLGFFGYEGTPYHDHLVKQAATKDHPEGRRASKYTSSTGIEPFDRPAGKGLAFNPVTLAARLADVIVGTAKALTAETGISKPQWSADHLFNPRRYRSPVRQKYQSDKYMPGDQERIFMVMRTKTTLELKPPKDKKPKLLSDIPPNQTWVSTGRGTAVPRSVFEIIQRLHVQESQFRLLYRIPPIERSAIAAVRLVKYLLDIGLEPTPDAVKMTSQVMTLLRRENLNFDPPAKWVKLVASVSDLLLPHYEIYNAFYTELAEGLLLPEKPHEHPDIFEALDDLFPSKEKLQEMDPVKYKGYRDHREYNAERMGENRKNRIGNIFGNKAFLGFLRHVAKLRIEAPAQIAAASLEAAAAIEARLEHSEALNQAWRPGKPRDPEMLSDKMAAELSQKRDHFLRLMSGWDDLKAIDQEHQSALYTHVGRMMRQTPFLWRIPKGKRKKQLYQEVFDIDTGQFKKIYQELPDEKSYVVHYSLTIYGVAIDYSQMLILLEENGLTDISGLKDSDVTASLLNARSIEAIEWSMPELGLAHGKEKGLPAQEWVEDLTRQIVDEAYEELEAMKDELASSGEYENDEIQEMLAARREELGVTEDKLYELMLRKHRELGEKPVPIEDGSTASPDDEEMERTAADDSMTDYYRQQATIERLAREEEKAIANMSAREKKALVGKLANEIFWSDITIRMIAQPKAFIKETFTKAIERYRRALFRISDSQAEGDEIYTELVGRYGEFNVLKAMSQERARRTGAALPREVGELDTLIVKMLNLYEKG